MTYNQQLLISHILTAQVQDQGASSRLLRRVLWVAELLHPPMPERGHQLSRVLL